MVGPVTQYQYVNLTNVTIWGIEVQGALLLLVFVAIACIIAGWRSASALPLYFLPDWGPMTMTVMMPLR